MAKNNQISVIKEYKVSNKIKIACFLTGLIYINQ